METEQTAIQETSAETQAQLVTAEEIRTWAETNHVSLAWFGRLIGTTGANVLSWGTNGHVPEKWTAVARTAMQNVTALLSELQTAVADAEDNSVVLQEVDPTYELSETGLIFKEGFSCTSVLHVLTELRVQRQALHWCIGDLANYDPSEHYLNVKLTSDYYFKRFWYNKLAEVLHVPYGNVVCDARRSAAIPREFRVPIFTLRQFDIITAAINVAGKEPVLAQVQEFLSGIISKEELLQYLDEQAPGDVVDPASRLSKTIDRIIHVSKHIDTQNLTYAECSALLADLEPLLKFHQSCVSRQLFLANECS